MRDAWCVRGSIGTACARGGGGVKKIVYGAHVGEFFFIAVGELNCLIFEFLKIKFRTGKKNLEERYASAVVGRTDKKETAYTVGTAADAR